MTDSADKRAAWAALGSDTRGSIRVPAALHGLVGFKNTQALTPTEGSVPLSFTLDHAGPGSLFRALGVFALRDIDLARIESRPLHGAAWRYRFFIDIRRTAGDPKVDRALEHLSEMVAELSVIGTYPAWPES